MIKKLFTITFLLTLSLFSFCQESFTCKSSDGKGDITFNTISKQISYNFPEFKSQISNFILLPKDNSYPSSVIERFSCNDEKNDKWVLCLVEIGKYHSFLLIKDDKSISITISYENSENVEKYLSYVFNYTPKNIIYSK